MKTFFLLFILSFSAFSADEEESEALRALRLACEKQRVGLGCFNYANLLIRNNKPESSDKYFEKGCALNHTPSCQKEKWDLPERKQIANELIPVSRELSKGSEVPKELAEEAPATDVPEDITSSEAGPEQITDVPLTENPEDTTATSEPSQAVVAPAEAVASAPVAPAPQPIAESTPQPVSEPVAEPVQEYVPQEVYEQVTEAEPIQEAIPEPMPEISEAVSDPSAGVAPASISEEAPSEPMPSPEALDFSTSGPE